jgi:hypothetical protein
LDFSSYYRKLRLKISCQYLTGFASDEGTYVHTRVPMGLKNVCAYSQRVLQEKLRDDQVLGLLGFKNYFDDLPFGAQSEDEFMHILEANLKFCESWKLKINAEKSVFGVSSIANVIFVVSKNHSVQRIFKNSLHRNQSRKCRAYLVSLITFVRHFITIFPM